MTCYRKGDCGPYNQTPCCECPASSPSYLQTEDSPATIGVTAISQEYISKDRAITIVKEQMAGHFAGDYAKLCPKCGKIAFWSTYFQGYRCIGCDDVIKSDNATDPRIQGIIEAIKKRAVWCLNMEKGRKLCNGYCRGL